MSILRVFPGQIATAERLRDLVSYVVLGKKQFGSENYYSAYWSVLGNGIPPGRDIASICDIFLRQHFQYRYYGGRIAYHILIDYNGALDPEGTCLISNAINDFWRSQGCAFVQGLHMFKRDVRWPHVHVVVCNIHINGYNVGRKLHIDKRILNDYKNFANCVLKAHRVEIVNIHGG